MSESVASPSPRKLHSRDERGFGLIEIVVTMFLLMIVSVALLPLLVQGLKLSAVNATLTAAGQLASGQIELLRSQSLCSAITPTSTTTTASGVTLLVSRAVSSSCPTSGYPTTVPVSITVTRTDTSVVVASANTLIFVTGR
ncbi:type II secretion system protein [Frigoribacterium sp. CG_9.8]|uniref:type IV pilus modification PilV family protein n=1 Tax=Frigoribacterium sp. CG_9.8 TaxID=2787733 RepID=UPI0018CA3112|nr:type II secretory pathway pseudopilin PulG [Frigoribacterium sp. CG_9.8]